MTMPDATSSAVSEQLGAALPDAVELRLPPDPQYLRMARYAASDAAARAGLGLDATDDLRLAVSELCTLLTGSSVPIELRIASSADGVVVEGRGAPGPHLAGENGDLARTLVEAVVDDYRFDTAPGRADFRITKRRVD